MVADPWCPYTCDPDSSHPGILIEVAKQAFAESGHTIRYISVPWARAIESVRIGQFNGIVGTGPEETPDFIYTPKEILSVDHTFFVRSEDSWRYRGLASLESRKLGVIKGYSHEDLEKKYVQPNISNKDRIVLIHGEEPLPRMLKLLLVERVDTLVEDHIAFVHTLGRNPEFNDVKTAGIYMKEEIFIAFSPSLESSKSYAAILNRFIEAEDGAKVDRIIEKYVK